MSRLAKALAIGLADQRLVVDHQRPRHRPDLVATMLHALVVPANLEIQDRAGRPMRACTGKPVLSLFA